MATVTDSGSEVSGLDYQETELKLALPGAAASAENRKRGFKETMDFGLLPKGGVDAADDEDGEDEGGGDDESRESKVYGGDKPPAAKNVLKNCKFVKVAVDGAPYLRKVDLETYATYQHLLTALEDMFSCFTICHYANTGKLVDPVNGTEYVPTYEDKDGDWMLVGDVPWKMFVESCKRLRLMKSSEAVNLATRAP